MVVYNFKKMAPVPAADDFIDIVLTRTQRKTPTVVHPGYNINRIRQFYMRKVKFTQETLSERLGQIIMDFPRLDDIHPFYADLLNILYDRDHYKLALGQINMAKKLMEALSRDYVRLLKYGDSLYRCKQLKRAALGRMMTLLKRQKASLSYLEEVRKHLARLPALDPNTRTLLLTGFPNVGKSSFMNKVTRANVDVQPYAFTTKSLYVGHMDYRYLRWQVVDTPGILDHALEERNTIEMQAVTALAHLQCCVLFMIDISEQCGYPIAEQLRLFESIKPLFANKQLIIVANKTDVLPFDQVREPDRTNILAAAAGVNVELMFMSNVSEEGVMAVKTAACDKLLQARVDARLAGKKVGEVMNRLTVAMPTPRDARARGASIPDSVLAARAAAKNGAGSNAQMSDDDSSAQQPAAAARLTEKERMWLNGGPGVYNCDYRKYYDLASDDWKFDKIPEIMDGKNVADYVDAEIDARLALLEREEDQLQAEAAAAAAAAGDESDVDEETRALAGEIRARKRLARVASRDNRSRNSAVMPRATAGARARTVGAVTAALGAAGVPTEGVAARGRKRGRSLSRGDGSAGGDSMDVDTAEPGAKRRADGSLAPRARSRSAAAGSRSASRAPREEGLKDDAMAAKARRVMKKGQTQMNRRAQAGESDRKYGPRLDKHMLAGKMGKGTRRSR
ncbi:Nog1, nucleolar GTPase [Tribonema minus]|uniref:Nucleolar GTP-binding protein 1 n=1 Tax=Tribonema minus TaxID=303371 RepID=A0A836CDN0_9STRA|nr:Nog1, nucleolar GTPase [Tribonema minus]